MKRLFAPSQNDKEDWTDEARALDREIIQALTPIIRRARQDGVSMIDLHYVLIQSLNDAFLSHKIGWDDETRPNETTQV